MRECRTYGSVRGAVSDGRPYRDLIKPFRKERLLDELRKLKLIE